MGAWATFFDSADLTPHGVCLLWRPDLLWLHVLSDSAIAFAYYSIPLALADTALAYKDVCRRFAKLGYMAVAPRSMRASRTSQRSPTSRTSCRSS